MTKSLQLLLFTLFYALTVFLAFNRHSKSGYDNYHSEIWADKAGYHVYLPATFKYQFNPQLFPDSIEVKTGNGFTLDLDKGKVLTKYTYGVAFMQMPFYFLMDVLAPSLGYPANGYSPPYHWAIYLAATFYLSFGLLFLCRFLRFKHSFNIALLSLLVLFLGSNLFFYTIDESGMSHVYSFFLFSVFLYRLRLTNYLGKSSLLELFFMGLLAALIFIIRPTNVVFLLLFFVLDLDSKKVFHDRIKYLLSAKRLLVLAIAFGLLILPQCLYWQYSLGSWMGYSYGQEGFNWLSPKPLLTWFSPNNGLFLYSPIFLLIVFATAKMAYHKSVNGWVISLLFLFLSYLFSAWWAWHFGCSFGARSFVEYLAVFVIPIAYVLEKLSSSSKAKKLLFSGVMVLLVLFNLMLSYAYDGCVYAKGNWDWEAYLKVLSSAVD